MSEATSSKPVCRLPLMPMQLGCSTAHPHCNIQEEAEYLDYHLNSLTYLLLVGTKLVAQKQMANGATRLV